MFKRELITRIMNLNRSATPEFLGGFNAGDLDAYLQRLLHLRQLRGPDLLQAETPQELMELFEPHCVLSAN